MTKYACLFGILLVLTLSSNLLASDAIEYPDFTLTTNSNPVNSTSLPWVQRADLQYNDDASVYWNRKYRVEVGQVTIIPFEYQTYDYNNKTNENDTGNIIEYHSQILLKSTFYENFQFFFGVGLSSAEINPEVIDSSENYIKTDGYNLTAGLDAGFALMNSLTLNFLAEWRMWEGAEGPEGGRNLVYGHRWCLRMMFLYEVFGTKDASALDIGLGFGVHYYHEVWKIDGVNYTISPNNTNYLDNGSENYDITIAVYYSANHWMNFGLEIKPLGILEARAFVTFIFM